MVSGVRKRKVGRPRKLKPIIKHDGSADKASRLDNSTTLDVHRVSDHPEVKSLINIVFQEMKQSLTPDSKPYVPKQKAYAHKVRDHLRIVLLNLCVTYFSDPHKYVRYHRNKNDYLPSATLHSLHLTHRYLVEKVIAFLFEKEYVEGELGMHFEDVKKISRMRATEKLMTFAVDDCKVKYPMIKQNDDAKGGIILRTVKVKKTVVRKNETKKTKNKISEDIDYDDTPAIIKMRENLKLINDVLDRNVILLEITDAELDQLNAELNKHPEAYKRRGGSIDFTKTRLRRVFNNASWEQGVRFYGGWWQRIPKQFRRNITINNTVTVEPDYSGLHINMLYAMEHLSMPEGDVYHLDGYSNDETFRKFVKRMLLVMVNAATPALAKSALHEEVHHKATLVLPPEVGSTKSADLDPLMDAFADKHAPIGKYFCSGKGVDLQNLDSQMAEKVMLHFAHKGQVVLPVHDSFVVTLSQFEELNLVMREAFVDLFQQGPSVDYDKENLKLITELRRALENWELNKGPRTREQVSADLKAYDRYRKMLKEFCQVKGVKPFYRQDFLSILEQRDSHADYKSWLAWIEAEE